MTVYRPRSDALPENTEYRDDGCSLHSSCLSCPLPRCRFDVAGGARVMLNRVRDHEIRRLRAVTGDPAAIAERMGVSKRTVYRVLSA